MNDLPYVDIDYCKYGMPYRKRTRLWNNVSQWLPKPLCKKDCDSMNGNKHKATAQRLPNGKNKIGEINHHLNNLIYMLFLKV
jgi:hypothetical protein